MVRLVGLLCLMAVTYASVSHRRIGNVYSGNRVPSEYLITVRPSLPRGQNLQRSMDSFVKKMADFSSQISVTARYDFTTLAVIHVKSESASLVSQLYSFSEVSSIEANIYGEAIDEDCVDQTTNEGLWGLARIAKRLDSNDNTYTYQQTDGAGGYVYVMDTGILTSHNDFGGRAVHGYTAPLIPESPHDLNGHGTHCAGTVMGATYGVAKSAVAIAVKILHSGGHGFSSDVVAGLEWVHKDFPQREAAAGGNLPAVVSISVGLDPSDAMDNAVQELFDIGLLTVTSAGNNATNACGQSPARAAAAVTVMSSDATNALARLSNHGPCADIIAPGDSILSAGNGDDDDSAIKSGTPMATPHVAGAVLRHQTQTIAKTGRKPTPSEVKEWLLESSTKDVIDTRGYPSTNNLLLYAPCDVTA